MEERTEEGKKKTKGGVQNNSKRQDRREGVSEEIRSGLTHIVVVHTKKGGGRGAQLILTGKEFLLLGTVEHVLIFFDTF